MRTSSISCPKPISPRRPTPSTPLFLPGSELRLTRCRCFYGKRRFQKLIPQAKKRSDRWMRSWWKRVLGEEGNWFGLKDDDMQDEFEFEEILNSSGDGELSEEEKFEAWKQRAEAIIELREAQVDIRNEENRMWEDWLVDPAAAVEHGNGSSWEQTSNDGSNGIPGEGSIGDDDGPISLRRMVKSIRAMVIGLEEDEILYEDRVFQYASSNSAKFLAGLIIVPWSLSFLAHDFVLMPFLDRYVKTVPLAAQMLDIRTSQKRELVKELKHEQARYRFEVQIGKSPPLSDKELYKELREKILEMREERRLENRREFANIWSDAVFGVSLFLLLYFNKSKVALLKFTGYKIINNISYTMKAVLIILVADTILGYHSAVGWEALVDVILEHYGLEVDEAAIIIFVGIVPVAIDAYIKYWIFTKLPKLSQEVATMVYRIGRH
ncbi:hypothetical protein DM860_005609 [Cuscuta australis]|uniref:Chloroplast envelope membrane protein n=1 Tax=Cuscuta australis TaxID=267555 RepID=A0A328DR71_9ASTE|nr:hypothetical protein DM860_005609 [Cuscuta australis]